MAYYSLNTQINKGKYKGKKVEELIKNTEGQKYLLALHIGNYNVFLNPEVFTALADYTRTKTGKLPIPHVSSSVCECDEIMEIYYKDTDIDCGFCGLPRKAN